MGAVSALGDASVEVAAGATICACNAGLAAGLVDFIGALAFFLAGFFAAFFFGPPSRRPFSWQASADRKPSSSLFLLSCQS
jgi:hypothetical protein